MENNLVSGLRAFKPNEKAPSFIIANVAVDKRAFMEWLKDKPDTVRLQLKESRGGKYFFMVDNYKPKGGEYPSRLHDLSNGTAQDDLPF